MSGPSEAAIAERRRVRRQLFIVIGVLLTFAGLALLALLLPSSPSDLPSLIPLAAGVALALWFGGLLLGRGMAARPPRSRA